MRKIYRMDKGYVHMDSYPATRETRPSIAVVLLALLLATITGMALVGVDPTNINPSSEQRDYSNRTSY